MKYPASSLRTIRDFIRWGASSFNDAQLFFGHGTDNAIDEAAALVLHAIHLPADLPSIYLESRLTKTEKQLIFALLQRRTTERKPAAYLMQRAWFAGLEFYVDERVLVPRSPIAELIEQKFTPWIDPEQLNTVLDLGTGSGCIGIAIAMYCPDARVDLVDISSEAITVASHNVAEFELEDRVKVIPSDVFSGVKTQRYDLIIANPPYVADAELAALPTEYHQEPALGLTGGVDGLDIVRRILREAHQHLEPSGVIIVEVGNSAAALELAYPEVPFLWLTFERGGEGVFLLTAQQLEEWGGYFAGDITHHSLFQTNKKTITLKC